MSQFSGRMTDSHGLKKHRDHKGDMVPDSPHQVVGTPLPSRSSSQPRNKGVMAVRKEIKREQAEERQSAYESRSVENDPEAMAALAEARAE